MKPEQIDLEAGAYRVEGRKEPILTRHWWVGVIAIVVVFAVAFASRLLTSSLLPH
jgi:hypothetical protein